MDDLNVDDLEIDWDRAERALGRKLNKKDREVIVKTALATRKKIKEIHQKLKEFKSKKLINKG